MPLVETEWALRASPVLTFAVVFFAYLVGSVAAQAPVNDIVSWPPGMLLLATVLYAGLGSSLDQLWAMDPCVGVFLGWGLPVFDLLRFGRISVDWTSKSYHFVPGVKEVVGRQACWVTAGEVQTKAQISALQTAEQVLACVQYQLIPGKCPVLPKGLVPYSALKLPAVSSTATAPPPNRLPEARDYLHFAVIAHDDEKQQSRPIANVTSLSEAQAVVADILDMDRSNLHQTHTTDFNSSAPRESMISAELQDLAESYYVVVQHLNRSQLEPPSVLHFAVAHCNGSLWLAILGGALLESGRLSFYLGDSQSYKYRDPGTAYKAMVTGVLQILTDANLVGNEGAAKLDRIVERGDGITRRSAAYPLLAGGIVCQAIVCYFLSVGTSAGVWTSVAMANGLFVGHLPDIHSVWRASNHSEPGIKMRMPGSDPPRSMVVATLHDSVPSTQDDLRAGFLLNITSVVAASLGVTYQAQTRNALGFGPFQQAQSWVLYVAIGISFGISMLLLFILFAQWIKKRFSKTKKSAGGSGLSARSELTAILSTAIAGIFLASLAVYFRKKHLHRLWFVLDIITFIFGLPLGALENGAILAVEENTLRLILMNRWAMGAVASAFGTAAAVNATVLIANATCTSVLNPNLVANATCTVQNFTSVPAVPLT